MRWSGKVPILVIEDDPEIRALVVSLLVEDASLLLEARSGREGLGRLQASAEHMVVVCSGVLRDVSAADLLEAVARDGGLARRHAYVLVTPEAGTLELARTWPERMPLFMLLEPYTRSELQEAVARAAQCVELSRTLYGAPRAEVRGPQAHGGVVRGERSGTDRMLRARGSSQPEPSSLPAGVVVVGGEPGIRTLIEHTLARGSQRVAHTQSAAEALTWLRASSEQALVLLNGTRRTLHLDFLRAAVEEASLVRHTYMLLAPVDVWLSQAQRDLLGMLNVRVVRKPFSPMALREAVRVLAAPAVSGAAAY